ncbi:MAG: Wzz/FepE/Etk N-terminal domain-containing protein [Pseudomonadota bacterium]
MDNSNIQQGIQESEFSLRDIYFVVFRHFRKIAVISLTVLSIALLFSLFFVKKTYQSDANMLVKTGRESFGVDRAALAGDAVRAQSKSEEIKTEIEIIRSREVIEAVVNSFGLDYFLKENEYGQPLGSRVLQAPKKALKAWVASLTKEVPSENDLALQKKILLSLTIDSVIVSLKVLPIQQSSIFTLSYEAATPQAAHDVLDKLIAVYLEKRSNIHFTDSSYKYLKEKTEELRLQLEQTEKDIRDFKNNAEMPLMQEQFFIDQTARIQQEVRDCEFSLAVSGAKIKLLREKIGTTSNMSGDGAPEISGAAVDEIHRSLSALRIKEQELLSTYTEKSIPVQEVQRQIREIQNFLPQASKKQGSTQAAYLSAATVAGIQTELINEEGTHASLQVKLPLLKERLEEVETQHKGINNGSFVLTQLERKKASLEANYTQYSVSLQQSSIDQSLKIEKISNISVAQHPTVPLNPGKSKKIIILIGGLCGGIGGGLALAFLLESLNHTLKKPDDIKRKLNLNYLVSVPHFSETQNLMPDISRIDNLTKIPQKPSDPKKTQNNPLKVMKHFEALLHRLIFTEKQRSGLPHTIAITSARTGEGVSTVATNLAVRLSRLGHGRVLLVDMNILSLDEPMALGPYPNLGNMLAIQEKAEESEDPSFITDKLYMIQYSEEKKATTELGELQNMWRKDYEFVVIDLPAVLDNSSVPTLSRLADKVILVVEAERERWEVINRAKELLEGANANIIGAILNKRNIYIPEWLYKSL